MQFVEEMAKILKVLHLDCLVQANQYYFSFMCVCKCNVHGNFQGGATMDLLEWWVSRLCHLRRLAMDGALS
jgi:hypothetical protein